ncbi:MAG: protein kinase [Tepidisphaeraceae bacterium]
MRETPLVARSGVAMDNVHLTNDPLLGAAPVLCGFKVLPPVVLVERLGEGAMGSVYRGRHLNLDIDVAVKCLKAELLAQNPEYVARFQREAKIAASINQENLVRVLDTLQDYSCCYTVMEFVDGETIEGRVVRKGALSVEESLSILLPSVRAMAALHERKIVHRDIKPPNIMVSNSGLVKLTDLGIAKEEENKGGTLQTNPQAVMGTPQYMPPEQFENTFSVNDRADIYAMGATLAFMLIGNHAIQGSSMHEILKKVCVTGFPDLASLAPTVPESVCAIVKACTQTDPNARPDAKTLIRDITKLLYSMGGEIPLADANASRSYGTGALPSRLDRTAVQQIKAAITQSRPSSNAVATAMGGVPRTIIESPPSTFQAPGPNAQGSTSRPKKSALPKILAAVVLLGIVGGAAATFVFVPAAKEWAMGLMGKKPAVTDGPSNNNSSTQSTGGTTQQSSGTNGTPTNNNSNNTSGNNNATPATILIGNVTDQRINVGKTGAPIPLQVTGFSGATAALKFDVTSSDANVVPKEGLKTDTSSSPPTLTITAGNTQGSATITVHVSDDKAKGERSFRVDVVQPQVPPPKLQPLPDWQVRSNTDTGRRDLKIVVPDGGVARDKLKLVFTSDNPTLLPQSTAFQYGDTNDPTWFRITPAQNKSGVAKVTITVSDGVGGSDSTSFDLKVTSAKPAIKPVNDVTVAQATGASAQVRLQLTDDDSPAADLKLDVRSSNEQVVPSIGLKLTGTGDERVLTITPAAGRDGQSQITATVTDPDGQTGETQFFVKVTKPDAAALFAGALKDVNAAAGQKDWKTAMAKLGDAGRNAQSSREKQSFVDAANSALLAFRKANPDAAKRRTAFPDQVTLLPPLTANDSGSSVAALLMVEYYLKYTSDDPIDIDKSSPDDLKTALEYAKLAIDDPTAPQYDACVHAHAICFKGGIFGDDRAQTLERCATWLSSGQRAGHVESTAWLGSVRLMQAGDALKANGGQRTRQSDSLNAEAEDLLRKAADAGSLLGKTNYGVFLYAVRAQEASDPTQAEQLRTTGARYLIAAAKAGYKSAQDRCKRFGLQY